MTVSAVDISMLTLPTLRTRICILQSSLTVLSDGSQAHCEGCRDWLYLRASKGCGVAGASGN